MQENNISVENTSSELNNSFNKQEIFRQIDQELLSQKIHNHSIVQRTRSNYRFIILVDLIALFSALVGVYFVYNIFKEQQIKLVSGRQGVKVLESTLLEEINKQYVLDLAKKEAELQNVKTRLSELETTLSNTLSQLQLEAELELEKQRKIMEQEIANQLLGKNTAEQEKIKQEYQNRILKIEQQIQERQQLQIQQEQERYNRMRDEENQKIETLNLEQQIQEAQNKIKQSQQELAEAKNQTPVSPQILTNIVKVDKIDHAISLLFLDVQHMLQNKQYDQVDPILNKIKNTYENSSNYLNIERKKADLYILTILQKYIQMTKNISELNSNQQQLIDNLQKQLAEQKENINDSSFMVSRNQLKKFISLISNNNIIEIRRQIQKFERNIPELIEFSQYYVAQMKQHGAPNIESLIKQADKFIQQKDYQKGIDVYQKILRIYSLDPRTEVVVQKLYDAITLKLQSKKSSDSASKIPSTISGSIQKILNNEKQIVYLKQPQGYIADIIDKDTVLVLLLSPYRVNARQKLEVFRFNTNYELKKTGELRVRKSQKDTFQLVLKNHQMKLGDFLYIKD